MGAQVLGKVASKQNPAQEAASSGYKPMYDIYKLEVKWVATGVVEVSEKPFNQFHSHTVPLGDTALGAAAFHQVIYWLQCCSAGVQWCSAAVLGRSSVAVQCLAVQQCSGVAV